MLFTFPSVGMYEQKWEFAMYNWIDKVVLGELVSMNGNFAFTSFTLLKYLYLFTLGLYATV